MSNYATLKSAIQQVIKTNGNNEITGALLQQSLLSMINSLGGYYQFAGVATPSTNPGTPDQNVYYIASTAGTYANFGGLVLADGEVAILKYNGAWSKDSTGVASLENVNQLQQKLIKYNDTEISVNDIIDGAYPKADLSGLSFGIVGKSTSRFAIQPGKTYRISLSGVLRFVCSNSQGSSWGGGMDTSDEAVFTNSGGWYYLCVGQTDPARAKVYIREIEEVIPKLEAGVAENKEQIETLFDNIGDINCRPISFVQNKSIFGLRYPPVDVDNPMSDNPGSRCAFVPVAPGEKVTINATGGGTARTWGFVDANGNVLRDSGYEVYEFKDYKIVAPALSAYLVINDGNTGGNCQIGESVKDLIDGLTNEVQESTFADGVKITSWAGIDEKYNKYIAADGREYKSNYRWTSDYIMVKPGSTISCHNMYLNIGGATCFGIACYDSNKVFISGKGISGNTAQVSDSFVVEDNIVYVKISDTKDSTATFDIQTWQPISEAVEETTTSIELLKSKIASFNKNGVSLLEGKTIALFGDSIFEIAGSASGARKRISDYLAEYTGATVLNFGFGGSSICDTHTSSPNYAKFDLVNLLPAVISGDLSEQETAAAAISQNWVDIVQSLETFSFSDCDIVVLGYGTNDYTNGSTINGVQQQLAISLQMIFEANTKIHIVLDLPHYRVWNTPDDFVDDAYTHLNSYGKTLGEYCDAIEETGKQFGVVSNPNLYNSGWNRYNMNEYFFHADGAHFLSNACKICAGRLFDTLNRQGWK